MKPEKNECMIIRNFKKNEILITVSNKFKCLNNKYNISVKLVYRYFGKVPPLFSIFNVPMLFSSNYEAFPVKHWQINVFPNVLPYVLDKPSHINDTTVATIKGDTLIWESVTLFVAGS